MALPRSAIAAAAAPAAASSGGKQRRKSTGFRAGQRSGAAGLAAAAAAAASAAPRRRSLDGGGGGGGGEAGGRGGGGAAGLLSARATLSDQLGELLLPPPEWLAAGTGPPSVVFCTGERSGCAGPGAPSHSLRWGARILGRGGPHARVGGPLNSAGN
jgi:hypothetical protein